MKTPGRIVERNRKPNRNGSHIKLLLLTGIPLRFIPQESMSFAKRGDQ